MTSERRWLVGFDDIRALTLECKKCKLRVSRTPDRVSAEMANTCPGCGHVWFSPVTVTARKGTSYIAQFLDLLSDLLKSQAEGSDSAGGVRILFEFDEPR